MLDVPTVAEIAAVVFESTLIVLTVKVTEVLPAWTVTVAGTVASSDPDPRVTTIPPTGAVPVRETVPVELFPPTTEVGLRLRLATPGGVTVRLALALAPFKVAVRVQLA